MPASVSAKRRYGPLLVAIFMAGLGLAACRPEAPAAPGAEPGAEASRPALAFTDITGQAGLGTFRHATGARGDRWFPEAMGSGVLVADFDTDGWLDIVLAGGGAWEADTARALWAFRNRGDGTFADVTEAWGLDAVTGYTYGLAAADVDADGDPDLYVTALGTNALLRNDLGGSASSDAGRFTDVTRFAGLAGETAWSTSAVFFDADRDGDADLYVGNYVAWTPESDIFCSTDGVRKGYCTPEMYEGEPGRFFRNDGDGTFTDATAAAGFGAAHGKTFGVLAFDPDRDGDDDLVLANDTDPDQLFRNRGDGTFEEVGVTSGIAFDERGRARAGMGIDAGVTDATGEETVFVGNFSNQTIGVYRHSGNGVFLDRAAVSKIGRPSLLTLTFGLFLFDADLDGDLDLFAANGHVQPDIEAIKDNVAYRQPAHLFLNDGDGTFADATPEIGTPLTDPLVARGAAYGDLDRDGDLDLLVMENGGGVHLWRNDLEGGTSLRVHLAGGSALGARVEAVTAAGRQVRMVRTGSTYLSQSELVATFGLAGADGVDSLVVMWPGGAVDRFAAIAAGVVRVTEGGTLTREDA